MIPLISRTIKNKLLFFCLESDHWLIVNGYKANIYELDIKGHIALERCYSEKDKEDIR